VNDITFIVKEQSMKVRKMGITTKIFGTIIMLLIVSDAVIGVTLYHRAESLLVTQIKENAMNIDKCVASSVDGECLDTIHAGDGVHITDVRGVKQKLEGKPCAGY